MGRAGPRAPGCRGHRLGASQPNGTPASPCPAPTFNFGFRPTRKTKRANLPAVPPARAPHPARAPWCLWRRKPTPRCRIPNLFFWGYKKACRNKFRLDKSDGVARPGTPRCSQKGHYCPPSPSPPSSTASPTISPDCEPDCEANRPTVSPTHSSHATHELLCHRNSFAIPFDSNLNASPSPPE